MKRITEDDEDKLKEQHTEGIIKNNGWTNGFTALLSNPRQL